jgi:hypothetical protein
MLVQLFVLLLLLLLLAITGVNDVESIVAASSQNTFESCDAQI